MKEKKTSVLLNSGKTSLVPLKKKHHDGKGIMCGFTYKNYPHLSKGDLHYFFLQYVHYNVEKELNTSCIDVFYEHKNIASNVFQSLLYRLY